MLLIYNYDMKRWLVLQPGQSLLAVDVCGGKQAMARRADYARYVEGTYAVGYVAPISMEYYSVMTSVCAVLPGFTALGGLENVRISIDSVRSSAHLNKVLVLGGGIIVPDNKTVSADAIRACF